MAPEPDMTEQQDFQSLDELFRNSFNNLPETPAASGWDTPSDAVWTKVQQSMPAKGSGWSAVHTLLTTGAVIAVALAGYFLLQPDTASVPAAAPAQPGETVARTPENQPAATLDPAVPAPQEVAVSPARQPVSRIRAKAETNLVDQPQKSAENPEQGRNMRFEAAPLPGSEGTQPHNNTELLWSKPMPVLPTVLEQQLAKHKHGAEY